MSETDPYAAPTVEYAKVFTEPAPEVVEAIVVEAQEAPVTPELVVPEGSIKKVLEWVGDDVTKALKALEVERAGEQRSTLISKLEALTN